MDLSNNRNPLRDLTFTPPPPPTPIFHRANSTGTNYPIIAVAVVGILATAFLLVSYYVFVMKCCLSWHRIIILRRFSLSPRRHDDQNSLMVYSPDQRNRGLDESVIRAIPIFEFKKRRDEDEENDDVFREGEEKNSQECSVCLNEFQEDEKLKIIPNCCHFFHIDCIDVWLQNNATCPLCRSMVSCDTSFPPDRVSPPSSSPENPVLESDTVVVQGENEFVVIEFGLGNDNSIGSNEGSRRNGSLLVQQERSISESLLMQQERSVSESLPVQQERSVSESLLVQQERSISGRILTITSENSVSPSPRKLNKGGFQEKGRKLHKFMSMEDNCVDTKRDKDEQFGIQTIRRSISMDSSADRQLYLAEKEMIFGQNREVSVVGDGGGCSDNVSNYRSMKRSFFSFGSNRRSRSSSILPLYFEH